jgi:FtsZ-interacting cell division protein ZipA
MKQVSSWKTERRFQVPDQTTLIIIVVAIVVVLLLISLLTSGRRRSEKLREKYGPEYDYTLQKEGDQRTAEETLVEREKRVKQFNIRTLDAAERDRYRAEWERIQVDFVDHPAKSVEEADRLVSEVMAARGFPVSDFDQQAADLSVVYPSLVSNYRSAHEIATHNQGNGASTEELRQSVVYYRSLYEELLGKPEVKEPNNR